VVDSRRLRCEVVNKFDFRAKLLRAVLVVGVLSLTGAAARADIVTSINTGVDSTGALLPDGALDPHYQLVSHNDPNFPGPNVYVVNSGGFPFNGYWFANGPNSKWIAPYADPSNNSPGVPYIYETKFDLTGYKPGQTSISGFWSTDNNGLDILLNGHSTGYTTPITSFYQFSPFSITSGFHAGVNTLDFVVFNQPQDYGNPTGLRVEGNVYSVHTPVAPTPEPSTLILAGLGGLGLLACGLKRRSALKASA
jgi:hypothetical protein